MHECNGRHWGLGPGVGDEPGDVSTIGIRCRRICWGAQSLKHGRSFFLGIPFRYDRPKEYLHRVFCTWTRPLSVGSVHGINRQRCLIRSLFFRHHVDVWRRIRDGASLPERSVWWPLCGCDSWKASDRMVRCRHPGTGACQLHQGVPDLERNSQGESLRYYDDDHGRIIDGWSSR